MLPVSQASIVITQQSVSGAPGVSRQDLVLGQPVTLTNSNDNGVRSWRWVMKDRPTGSSATLNSPLSATVTFTPDVPGSYLVELTVDDGRNGQVDTRIAAVLETINGSDVRWPASGEDNEANWNIGGSPNERGWVPALEDMVRALSGLRGLVDTRGTPESLGPIADSGGTDTFEIDCPAEDMELLFLRVVATGSLCDDVTIEFFRDAARTDQVYALENVDPSTQYTDRNPATVVGDDGSSLENSTLYGRMTNNSASTDSFEIELVARGIAG